MGRYLSPLVKQDLAKLGEDGESRRIALNSLKSFVEQLDLASVPRFLAQIAESREQGTSRAYAISLYEDVARVHGKMMLPYLPRIMSTITRFLSASGSSLQLHQACANVVVGVVQYVVDPLSSLAQAQGILRDVCEPLLEVLAGTFEPLAAGAAICLQALVESERWKFASTDLIQDTCLRATVALGDKATRTIGHMQLARALALMNGDVLGVYGLALLRSACETLRTFSGNGSWHHRVSAARLIQAVLSNVDRISLAAEVGFTMQVLERFRHDRIPHVRSAVIETLQTAKILVSEENSRRSNFGEEPIGGMSFTDSDYYKKPLLNKCIWSDSCNASTAPIHTNSKIMNSRPSQESQVVSFSPSPSSSDSHLVTNQPSLKKQRHPCYPLKLELPKGGTSHVKKNERGQQHLTTTTKVIQSQEKENYVQRLEGTRKGEKYAKKRDSLSKTHAEMAKSSHPLNDLTFASKNVLTQIEQASALENKLSVLEKDNSLLRLFDSSLFRDENNYLCSSREDKQENEDGQAEFTSIKDFEDQGNLESMIHKETIGRKTGQKNLDIHDNNDSNSGPFRIDTNFLEENSEQHFGFLEDSESKKCALQFDKPTSMQDKMFINQQVDRELAEDMNIDASSSTKGIYAYDMDSTTLDFVLATNEIKRDVEEIELHTSSENGWSVHHNPIASSHETFEPEEQETGVISLHCSNSRSKKKTHEIYSTKTNNELEYSSSGSNTGELRNRNHEIAESVCTSRLRGGDYENPIQKKEILTSSSSLQCFEGDLSRNRSDFKCVEGADKRPSQVLKSTHQSSIRSWKKKCKGAQMKYQAYSYSTFFFLEKQNWTRVWSCLEIFLGGSICAMLALPVAMAVSTAWDPIVLDYRLLVPT